MRKTLTVFILTVVALLGVGIVVMASASASQLGTPDHYFKRQLMWLFLAIAVGFTLSRFNYHNWEKWLSVKNQPLLPAFFYMTVVILLALTLCPGLKREINGSYRWLVLGPVSIQPGEFAKLAIIIATAAWMSHIKRRVAPAVVPVPLSREDYAKGRLMNFIREIVVPGLLLGVFVILLYLEKDLGAAAVICVLGMALMCVAGMRKVYLVSFGLTAVAFGTWWIRNDKTRLDRFNGWWQFLIDPSSATDVNNHVQQSVIAFKSGGLWGTGLNKGIQKYQYLAEAHTDFVAAIGAEELGFFFSIGVLVAYAILLVSGTLISLRAPDRLGRLLGFGMVLLLVFQGAFNIGVVTGAFPTKGLALPFISYGGSNLITAMFAVGTLLNIGMQVDEHEERTCKHVDRKVLNEA